MNKLEYKRKNEQWLEEKAKEEGVIALPRGIYYKVLAEGNNDGRHPSPRSIITAHYTGKTINGKKFDSSRGGAPLAMRLSDLLTSSLKKHTFYNLLINNILYLCVTYYWVTRNVF